jgi:DNA-binding CsgD family transcriptional regulator
MKTLIEPNEDKFIHHMRENVAVGVIYCQTDGLVFYANKYVKERLGHDPVGSDAKSYRHSEPNAGAWDEKKGGLRPEFVKTGMTPLIEEIICLPTGEQRMITAQYFIDHDKHGAPYIIMYLPHISESDDHHLKLQRSLRSAESALEAMLNMIRSLKRIPKGLTATERNVAAFIRDGLQTKEIAERMNISERTVENHRYHIRKKLNLKSYQHLPVELLKYRIELPTFR